MALPREMHDVTVDPVKHVLLLWWQFSMSLDAAKCFCLDIFYCKFHLLDFLHLDGKFLHKSVLGYNVQLYFKN